MLLPASVFSLYLGLFGSTASWIRSNYPHVYFGPGLTALFWVSRSRFDNTNLCTLSSGSFPQAKILDLFQTSKVHLTAQPRLD